MYSKTVTRQVINNSEEGKLPVRIEPAFFMQGLPKKSRVRQMLGGKVSCITILRTAANAIGAALWTNETNKSEM